MTVIDPTRCPHCGNKDGTRILAIEGEREKLPNGREQVKLWWKCAECSVEWKSGYNLPRRTMTRAEFLQSVEGLGPVLGADAPDTAVCDCQHPEETADGFRAVSVMCPIHGDRR